MHCLALEEFAAEGEVFELPETSWNQRDEVLLAAGAKVTAASADFSPFFAGTLDFHMNLKTLRFLFPYVAHWELLLRYMSLSQKHLSMRLLHLEGRFTWNTDTFMIVPSNTIVV